MSAKKEELEKRLAELKGELASVEGTDTEVYSRIVGYYRAVRNWNAGKREEYGRRKMYAMPGKAPEKAPAACIAPTAVPASASAAASLSAALPSASSTKAGPATVSAADFRPVHTVKSNTPAAAFALTADSAAALKSGMLVFTRATCPNCPPVKEFVGRSGLPAVFVDVEKEEGLALARRHNVMATPTVVGIDADGAESFRAYSVADLKAALSQQPDLGLENSAAQSAR